MTCSLQVSNSGKTYTISGQRDQEGIVPLALRDLFDLVATRGGTIVRNCPCIRTRVELVRHPFLGDFVV